MTPLLRLALVSPLIGLMAILFGTPAAAQSSIAVNTTVDEFDAVPNASCSLREAIQSANTASDFGGCSITGAGPPYGISLDPITYTLAIAGAAEDANASGDLDVLASVSIEPSPGGLATIDGADLDRVFDLHVGSSLSVTGVVIRNGSADTQGGGVRVTSATFSGTGCIIEENQSGTDGGGLYANSGVTISIDQCEISNNVVDFDANNSSRGGALYVAGTGTNTVTIANSTLAGNNGDTFGGGVATLGTTTTTVTITNSTISGNTVNTSGGGISSGGPMFLDAVTIVGNTSNTTSSTLGGGGLRRVNGTVTMRNSIVANNDAVLNTCDDVSGTASGFVTLGANLIGDHTCLETVFPAGTPNGSGDWAGTDAAPIDPLLGPLENNGGFTRTHALLDGSVARDNGNTALPTDQRGEPRDATPDIGSYEVGIPVQGAPQPGRGREFVLSTVAPNPSSTSARVTLAITEPQIVRVTLHDVTGRTVVRVHDGLLAPDREHEITVDGSALAAGVYLLRVAGERFEDTRTVVFR